MTMQDVMGGVSQSRNMVLANIFYRLELIESYGTGIRRIMESHEGRMEQPVFAPAPASFVVILPKITGQPLTDESLTDRRKGRKAAEGSGGDHQEGRGNAAGLLQIPGHQHP